jgi:uncharacterized protein (TIGR03437 family)
MLMRSNFLKLITITVFIAALLIFGLNGSSVVANRTGPPASRTGAPGASGVVPELTCATTECHLPSSLNTGPGTLAISGLPPNYAPNQEIAVTVTLTQPSRSFYGFQATALDDTGKQAGTITVTDSSRTQLITGTVSNLTRSYIEHNFTGTSPNGPNQGSWTFRWRAPEQPVGRVTFYAAGNAANGDGTMLGDFIYTTSASTAASTGLPPITSVSAASFAPDGLLAPEAIAAGFGTGLSQNTVPAPGVPLPPELDGTQVQIRDAGGTNRIAPLFLVSPLQINYLVPQETVNGPATVTVLRNGNPFAQGAINIDTIAPAIFTANADGRGVPAAVIFRVRGGQLTSEAILQFNPTTGLFEALPIDLGPETDVVILSVFGSGFRNINNQLAMVSCTIGGVAAGVEFADDAPGFVGLDQANIRIPRSLAGRGNADVVFTVAGKPANTVTINLR